MDSIYGIAKDVFSPSVSDKLKVLMLGTCQIEFLVGEAQKRGAQVDYFLYDSRPHALLPNLNNLTDYNACVVALTFRSIFNKQDDIFDLHFFKNWNPIQSHELLERFKHDIDSILGSLASIGEKMPVFITSFMYPSFSIQGLFKDRFSATDITEFITHINRALYSIMKKYPQLYYVEMNDIANQAGLIGLRDDITTHFSHMSWVSDWAVENDKNRLQPIDGPMAQFDTWVKLEKISRIYWDYIEIMYKSLDQNIDKFKIIITDLDDTLWRGVAADSDENIPDGEQTEGWPLGYVEALLEFKNRGGLLAICSKNDEAATLERLQKIWKNRITVDDFVSVKINWQPKSENIKAILKEVNLLAKNALFVDDNPREIDEVKSNVPDIKTLSENHYLWRAILLTAPELQVTTITEESKNRTELVKATIERSNQQADSGNREEWLRSLQIEQHFEKVDNSENKHFNRTFELINKTNQFNTNGKRWAQSEILELFENGGYAISMFLKDRSVDNGLVGVALVQNDTIEQVVMSCRVFGLGAEQSFGKYVTDLILANHPQAKGQIQDTGKNFACHNFFEELKFTKQDYNWVTHMSPPAIEWISIV